MKRLTLKVITLAFLLTNVFGVLTLLTPAQALSGSEFKAGRIIDDELFFNANSMNASEIQTFLNAKMPACDTQGAINTTYKYDAPSGRVNVDGDPTVTTSRAVYGERYDHWLALQGRATVGSKAPYICVKDYTQNITGKAADSYCAGGIGSGLKTAAQIINDVAKACGVSPKVLLVLLQKEQTLITDDWPWGTQYDKATGFSCPDSAPCNPEFAGFFNQVYYAARQYQRYSKQADLFSYRAGRNNSIQWSPNSSCGSSSVFIANQATAGLYNYTPYQPNAAALNNLYGIGDSCSAYGNRNFWRMFNDWFGTTITDFKWDTTGYQIWDTTETYRLDPGLLEPGVEYVAKLHAINTGSATWSNSNATPVRLGTNNPAGHDSDLCHRSWLWCGRVVNIQDNNVAPGEGGDFKFRFTAPYIPGMYREYFKPVAEMLTWFNDVGESLGIRVVSPGTFKWSSQGYQVWDSTESFRLDPGNLQPNTLYIAKLYAINTGTATWKNNGPMPVRLGTNNPPGRDSQLCQPSWLWCGRPVNLQESTVAPGNGGNFKFYFRTPSTPGSYRENFKPVAELFTWFNDIDDPLGIVVR